jgi:DNA-binding GntR family transcriptional regulator
MIDWSITVVSDCSTAQKSTSQSLPRHSKLPSEVALAKQYGVSRGTVTKAMETLVRQAVLYRRRPQGTFVASWTLALRLTPRSQKPAA